MNALDIDDKDVGYEDRPQRVHAAAAAKMSTYAHGGRVAPMPHIHSYLLDSTGYNPESAMHLEYHEQPPHHSMPVSRFSESRSTPFPSPGYGLHPVNFARPLYRDFPMPRPNIVRYDRPYESSMLHQSSSYPCPPTCAATQYHVDPYAPPTPSSFPNFMTSSPNPDDSSTMDVFLEKQRRRKQNHNAVERRRRDHINDMIRKLADLVPGCSTKAVDGDSTASADEVGHGARLNKGEILQSSVEYIVFLQNCLQEAEENLSKMNLKMKITEFKPEIISALPSDNLPNDLTERDLDA